MEIDVNDYLGEFLEEMTMLLENFDNAVLELENDPKKNSLGFSKMENLTHNMEDVLYDVRDGKILITSKIIDLLFVCHDYLNQMLVEISEKGTEKSLGSLNIDKIIKKLHNILEKQQPLKIDVEEKLKLTEEDKKNMRIKLEKKEKLLLLDMTFDKKCKMKKVRGFMALNTLKNGNKIIKTLPTEKQLSDEDFDFKEQHFYILLITKKNKPKIEEEINNLIEVNINKIEEIEDINEIIQSKEDEEIEELIKKEEESGLIGANEEKRELELNKFEREFILEIKKQIISLKKLVNGKKNKNITRKIYMKAHVIEGIAKLINKKIIAKSMKVFQRIIKEVQKNNKEVDQDLWFLIKNGINLIEMWCENPTLEYNEQFQLEINHIYSNIESKSENKDKFGTILQDITGLKDKEIEEISELQKTKYKDKKFGEVALETKKVTKENIEETVKKQEKIRKNIKLNDYIRIASHKADGLVDMIGELMIVQAQLEQSVLKQSSTDNKIAGELGRMFRITKKIQSMSMSFRMVDLRSTFQKVNRTVRDTLHKLDKKINFIIDGEETEVDKSVVDKLLEPIIHLVKNSISHGIEDDRIKIGKSKMGNVKLKAFSKKGYVYITISDDGKGMDPDMIYKKALDKGIAKKGVFYTDKEKLGFIFYPGFSTAETVGKISGRGVGMDVVQTEISKIGGKIEMKSEIGKGSSFSLKIPINMSMMDGTIVDLSGENYIVPTSFIKEIFKIEEEYWVDVQGKRNMIKIRNEIIPIVDIDKHFQSTSKDDFKMFIVFDVDGKSKALPVNNILERREVVVKPLGKEFDAINHLAGASILGNGKVSLILDVEKL
ncbi:MAG: hypothetical protein B6I28_04840 [Fusobacteriia bacterium 4572_132]|nr:MAG: hypothetical protein B6I28_04840 [Fusobacteriia bacterium 4572_132]